MADLTTELREVGARAIRRLNDHHDDHVRTSYLWQEILNDVRYGRSLVVRNTKTGTVTTTKADWTVRSYESRQRLRVRTFKDLVGAVERFVADLLTVWLRAHPELVEERSITLATLLACTSLAEAKAKAVDEAVVTAVLKRMHGKPAGWFAFLRVHAGCRAAAADVDAFAERKAARDVLEHNEGVVNDVYAEKAGPAAAFVADDLVEPDDAAIDALYDMTLRLAGGVAADAERAATMPAR